jgi:hypothetical protein
MEVLACKTVELAMEEYKKHKAPKRIVHSPHPDNKNGDYFVEWGKSAHGMIRVFEKVIRSKH